MTSRRGRRIQELSDKDSWFYIFYNRKVSKMLGMFTPNSFSDIHGEYGDREMTITDCKDVSSRLSPSREFADSSSIWESLLCWLVFFCFCSLVHLIRLSYYWKFYLQYVLLVSNKLTSTKKDVAITWNVCLASDEVHYSGWFDIKYRILSYRMDHDFKEIAVRTKVESSARPTCNRSYSQLTF